jgi:arabinofuranosyltransferase
MSRAAAHLSQWTRSCVKQWPALLLAAAATALFVAHCLWVGDAKIDDAYITFSFSKNLALGRGPVFSHGVRVEGYSTFLWMVLVAVPLVFTRGAAPLTCARVMGAPFLALLGWSVYRLARALGASRAVAAVCVLLLTFDTDLVVAYLTGMETAPYVALVAFACLATARSVDNSRWMKAAAWGGLAVALMRIDGFVPWGAIMGWSFLRAFGRKDRKAMRAFFRTFGPPILVYGLWFLWRWHYYGLPLPSTYYAKALTPKLMPERGAEYVSTEVFDGWLWAGLIGWVWLVWRRRLAAALLGCFVIIHWCYVASVGGDWMPFGRFMLPTVPLVVLLLVVAGGDAARCAFRARNRFRWLVPALPAALAAVMVARMDHRFLNIGAERGKLASVAEAVEHVGKLLQAAEVLNEIVPPGGHLVTDYGGVMGYYTDAHIIEMWGLANATIATRGGTEGVRPFYGRTCPSCYPELGPEYFHVMQPLMRSQAAFASADDVIRNVWQTDTIGRYIDFRSTFAVGRAYSPKAGTALFFLQKRAEDFSPSPRQTKSGFVVDYPFEGR